MSETTIIDNRIAFLEKLPKNGVVCELGVWKGVNAKNIYEISTPKHLYLIDTWYSRTNPGDYKVRSVPEWERMYQNVVREFHNKNATVIRAESHEAATQFGDEFFDWVYIDAGHSFESCYADLWYWYRTVKKGGYICGHDYCETDFTIQKGFGVKRAVDQFLSETNLEIEFLSDNEDQTDYAIIKK